MSDLPKKFPDALALKHRRAFANRLLKWFDNNQRDLPWRKNKTPYRIWVSEIMLQQTQVATVIGYFNRFIKRFPSVKKLANADVSEVLKHWEGLGYYRRARQMHAAANVIMSNHNGRFPGDFETVVALPGIGRYTASAILSISKDQPLPILEGNTVRLYSRLLLLKTIPKTTENQKLLWQFAEFMVPQKNAGDFNQALMELGNQICRPVAPRCDQCPLSKYCPTFIRGLQKEIPRKSPKMVYENITEAVVVIKKNGKYLVRQCSEKERWAGLWDFPRYKIANDKISNPDVAQQLQRQLLENLNITAKVVSTDKTIRHAVTRFRITLKCFRATSVKGRLGRSAQAKWFSQNQLEELPMSVTGRKIADSLDELLAED